MNLRKYLLVETPLTPEEGKAMRNAEIDNINSVISDCKRVIAAAKEDLKTVKEMDPPTVRKEQFIVTKDHPDYDKARILKYEGVPLGEMQENTEDNPE